MLRVNRILCNILATALEFAALSSGKIGAISYGQLTSTYAISSSSTYLDFGLQATITPTAAGSSFIVIPSVCSSANTGANAGFHFALYRKINAGSFSKIDYFTGDAASSRNRGLFAGGTDGGAPWTQESSSTHVLDNATSGLSYSLGNTITYNLHTYSSGTVSVINRSYRDDNTNDDTRTMSSILILEVLA